MFIGVLSRASLVLVAQVNGIVRRFFDESLCEIGIQFASACWNETKLKVYQPSVIY